MASSVDNATPQWKKDLIARLRNQNKRLADDHQLYGSPHQPPSSASLVHTVQQPILTSTNEAVESSSSSAPVRCKVLPSATTCSTKMVQERVWLDHNMVSETFNNGYHKGSDSDSSEDLRYGPGIVSKLKNKYLSLALRESNARTRPSILHMRKATSLENMLEDDNSPHETTADNRLFQPRLNGKSTGNNATNRYRSTTRVSELKRARSVEAISRSNDIIIPTEVRPKRESLHEEMLITAKEGNDKPYRKVPVDNKPLETENKYISNRINRPKRITPIMNEKEKPPADVVKQAKLIFERRPEQRTRAPPLTGEVAAKVDSYNNIIVKSKTTKKPPIKHKPVLNEKSKSNTPPVRPKLEEPPKPTQPPKNLKVKQPKSPLKIQPSSPIPDVSRIEVAKGDNDLLNNKPTNNLISETPDLILTSSPLPSMASPTYKKNTTEKFIKEEIRNCSRKSDHQQPQQILLSPILLTPTKTKPNILNFDESDTPSPTLKKTVSPQTKPDATVFNFVDPKITNKNVLNTKTPPSEQLKIEINGNGTTEAKKSISPEVKKSYSPEVKKSYSPEVKKSYSPEAKKSDSPEAKKSYSPEAKKGNSPKVLQPSNEASAKSPPKTSPVASRINDKSLTITEIEKNHINTVKTLQQPTKPSVSSSSNNSSNSSASSSAEVNKIVVPRKRQDTATSNTEVFNFTSRTDVPDYISNDRSRSPGRPELPKPGEGGIILIPGASISESFTDEDEEELMRSLEAPPSPCDVAFVNDNILIDGKSSLSQKSKKSKMRITFVEAGPDVFEYPSENSLLQDDVPTSPIAKAQVGHTVPNINAGSTLANYTPKSTEQFQPGVTRSIQNSIPAKSEASATDSNNSKTILEELENPIVFSSGTNSDILF